MILGMFGFAGAGLVVGAYMAGWYGSAATPGFLMPFVTIFGGLATFVAGLWGFRARDGLATGILGVWGSFWMSYGLLYLLFSLQTLARPTGAFTEFGVWFAILALITLPGVAAALAVSWTTTVTLGLGFVAAGLASAGYISGSPALVAAGGWFLVAAAVAGWYASTALLLESSFGHEIIPIFRTRYALNQPQVDLGKGEPGVKRG